MLQDSSKRAGDAEQSLADLRAVIISDRRRLVTKLPSGDPAEISDQQLLDDRTVVDRVSRQLDAMEEATNSLRDKNKLAKYDNMVLKEMQEHFRLRLKASEEAANDLLKRSIIGKQDLCEFNDTG